MSTFDERAALDALRTLLAFFAQSTARPVESRVVAYTSSRVGPHPVGKSARWCRDHFASIPGARRIGRDWTIAVDAFDAWADEQARLRRMARTTKGAPIANDVSAEAARAIAGAGLRATRAGHSGR